MIQLCPLGGDHITLTLGIPPCRAWQEGGTETRDASTSIPVMICGRHLWLGCTCTEDTLQWRHQDCVQSMSKLWMLVSSEQHCSFGWEVWLSIEEINYVMIIFQFLVNII